jgi:hypothetical protein
MNFPTTEKTWTWRHLETNTGSAETDWRNCFVEMIASLAAAGATMQLWSNGTDSGTGTHTFTNTDFPASSSTLINYAVMRFSDISGASKDILIAGRYYTGSTSVLRVTVQVSVAGFSGGNTTTLPTATDTITLLTYTNTANSGHLKFFTGDNTTKKIFHSQYASDGSAWRFFVSRQGIIGTAFGIEEVDCDTEVPSSEHWVCWGAFDNGTDANVLTEANFHDNANAYNYSAALAGQVDYYLTAECKNNTILTNSALSVPNPRNSNSWPIMPIGLWTETSASYAFGKDFRMIDIWWCSSLQGVGSYYSDNGSTKKIVNLCEIAVPWDNSTGVWS